MHQRSLSELQGVSTQRGASTRRTIQDRASRSSKPRRGSGQRCLCPPRGAPLWAWLLLGALVVPGACSFLSEEQEELLVELHNYYRGQVSPSASAMLPLKWDPNLKVIAEGYAAKCVWNHNPELEDTGENLYAGTGSLDLREALEKWFMEHLDYDFNNNSCDEEKMCGHYTQMVWADTHRVGCAFHLCSTMEGLEWERVSYLVCNYYPAGNYEDERPYVEGDWCSRCPENLQTCENNLCVDAVDDIEEEEEEEEEEMPTIPAEPAPALDESITTTSETAVPLDPTTAAGDTQHDAAAAAAAATTRAPTTRAPTTTTTTISTSTSAQDPEDTPTPAPGTVPPPDVPFSPSREEFVETVEKTESADIKSPPSAASASSPSLLLACLTGILTLRL